MGTQLGVLTIAQVDFYQDLSLDLLLSDPLRMPLNIWVSLNLFKGVKFLGQRHLIIMIVNTVMTKAANKHAAIEFHLGIALLKTSAAV